MQALRESGTSRKEYSNYNSVFFSVSRCHSKAAADCKQNNEPLSEYIARRIGRNHHSDVALSLKELLTRE